MSDINYIITSSTQYGQHIAPQTAAYESDADLLFARTLLDYMEINMEDDPSFDELLQIYAAKTGKSKISKEILLLSPENADEFFRWLTKREASSFNYSKNHAYLYLAPDVWLCVDKNKAANTEEDTDNTVKPLQVAAHIPGGRLIAEVNEAAGQASLMLESSDGSLFDLCLAEIRDKDQNPCVLNGKADTADRLAVMVYSDPLSDDYTDKYSMMLCDFHEN